MSPKMFRRRSKNMMWNCDITLAGKRKSRKIVELDSPVRLRRTDEDTDHSKLKESKRLYDSTVLLRTSKEVNRIGAI